MPNKCRARRALLVAHEALYSQSLACPKSHMPQRATAHMIVKRAPQASKPTGLEQSPQGSAACNADSWHGQSVPQTLQTALISQSSWPSLAGLIRKARPPSSGLLLRSTSVKLRLSQFRNGRMDCSSNKCDSSPGINSA